MSSKRASNYVHFKHRMLERFGITMNQDKLNQIIKMIKNGEAKPIGRQSLARTHFKLHFEGHSMIVVYDSRHHNIVTCLYPGEEGDN